MVNPVENQHVECVITLNFNRRWENGREKVEDSTQETKRERRRLVCWQMKQRIKETRKSKFTHLMKTEFFDIVAGILQGDILELYLFIIFTPPPLGQDMTQGQFLSGV